MNPLRPWRELIEPHRDVLKGVYSQSEFAADISRVHAGKATEEYQNPALFFQRTFITEGMKLLLLSVLKRLGGKGGDPVIQLQTAFGGGKTHTLLAVYHLARATCSPSELSGIPPILDAVDLHDLPRATVAVIDGINMSANQPVTRNGCRIHTLWGELAVQLGGPEAYALLEASDTAGTSPSKELLEQIIRTAAPCVILIDELVAYMRQFGDKPLTGGTLSTNLTFVQALTEALKGVPNAVLLASLPQSNKEAGDQNGIRALDALAHTFGRVQAIWKPVATEEAFEIVRRRLFSTPTTPAAVDAVCTAFADFYRDSAIHFPQETQESHYLTRLRQAYPIHPEIFDRLYEDWSSLDSFQRTRGVLKFMAKVIHRLWQEGNADPLIMPGSLPLHHGDTRNDIVAYLPQGWDPVLEKDIDGERSEAQRMDTENTRFGSCQACRRVARSIFLGSAPSAGLGNTVMARGIEDKRIFLGAIQPGMAVGTFKDALSRLNDKLYYLNSGNDRFWFDTRPNLRREMEERKQRLMREDSTPFIKEALRGLLRGTNVDGQHIFSASGDIPDDEQLRLVVFPPIAAYSKTVDCSALDEARAFLQNRGEQPRTHRNRLLFLAPDFDNATRLLDCTRTALAWKSIENDSLDEKLNLDQYQIKQVRASLKTAELTAHRAVVEAFRWLLIPYEKLESPGEIIWEIQSIPSGNETLAPAIDRLLRENEYVIDAWAPVHLAKELELFWKTGETISALKVWQDCCKYVYLPRLRSRNVFTQTLSKSTECRDFFSIAQGEINGTFVGFAFGTPTLVFLDESTLLIKLDRALDYEKSLLPKPDHGDPVPLPPHGGDGHEGGTSDGGGNPDPFPPPSNQKMPTRYYGAVVLDPLTGHGDAQGIFNELIQHLAAKANGCIRVTLEVEANNAEGFDVKLQRTVRENGNTLGFHLNDFE